MLKLFGDPAYSVEDDFCAYDGDDDSFAAYSNQPFPDFYYSVNITAVLFNKLGTV